MKNLIEKINKMPFRKLAPLILLVIFSFGLIGFLWMFLPFLWKLLSASVLVFSAICFWEYRKIRPSQSSPPPKRPVSPASIEKPSVNKKVNTTEKTLRIVNDDTNKKILIGMLASTIKKHLRDMDGVNAGRSSVIVKNNNVKQNNPNGILFERATTIFLYVCNQTKQVSRDKNFPGYLKGYSITNPQEFFDAMIDSDFLQKPPLETILSTFKVAELKEIALQISSTIPKKKNDLVHYIFECGDKDSLAVLSENYDKYILSDTAHDFLKRHSEYVLLHKYPEWDIPLQRFLATRTQMGSCFSSHDVLWRIFNDKIAECSLKRNHGYLVIIYQNMATFLFEEGRERESLFYSLNALYYELNGVINWTNIKNYMRYGYTKAEIIESFIPPTPSPYLLGIISDRKSLFKESAVDKLYKIPLPFNLCPKEIFLEYIDAIFSTKNSNFSKLEKKWDSKFLSLYAELINKL